MKVYKYVFAAAFAALIAVSGLFIVPLPGGVPVVLKNLFVVLAGAVLGGFYGGAAVLIFLAAGLAGIPVFVIPGGPAVFLTPLGGYLAGYFAGSLAAGLISGKPSVGEKKIRASFLIRLCLASFSGFALIDLCGALYMMFLNSMTFKAALIAGVVPFIIGDAVKFAVSVPLALKLRPLAARYLNPEDGGGK
ncbi:MAG: biotin transporter BioY [Treponema sp.]|jgi:biotin transport system substrate-specific component|nr:biotin transporter BioY [Treponema sp.]